jgi:hypothetical protein
MSLHGWQVPCGKRADEAARRKEVFDIAAPYCMSEDDILEVGQSPEKLQDLWFESFANSNRVLVHESLQKLAKSHFLRYFPSFGNATSRSVGAMLGLEAGQTILDRY